MSVEKDKIEIILSQLPEDLQHEVVEFAEALLVRSRKGAGVEGLRSVRSFFGVWDSGDTESADNDEIDADLARQYAGPHKAD